MKVLVIGGTVFLGRHVVAEALSRGHEVTLFNRGSDTESFAGEVERVLGDRNTDIANLGDARFDYCIDTSGYLPHQLVAAGTHLASRVDRYAFVSSISVYAAFKAGMDESAALSVLPDDADPTVYDNAHYGPLKVLCEAAIEAAMPGRVLHVRSGLIVGPHDPTHRFTYWPVRVAKGGEFIAPSGPDFPIQMIHARDQARWIFDALEAGNMGAYNVTSPAGTYTMGDVIAATVAVTGADATPRYASSDFLTAEGVGPWMELPLWLPEAALGMSRVSAERARQNGLSLMPLEDIVRDTLAWFDSVPAQDWPAGLAADREAALLAKLPG